MKAMSTRLLSLFCICACALASRSHVRNTKLKVQADMIQTLFDMTSDLQIKEDVPLKPLRQYYKQKGVYPSDVKLNFHGEPDYAQARRLLYVFDNNMFGTAWVSSSLLEAYRYGQAPKPTEMQLMIAIESLQKHVDWNKPYNNSLMFFWPVAYNQSAKFWQATPVNLLASLNATGEIPLNVIIALLDLLGLQNLTSYVEGIFAHKDAYIHTFHLCPDMDDTFLNLGLGSLLYEMRDGFPESSDLWNRNHNNLTSIFDALKKYSYRPFHNDSEFNTLDPRTYMYLRFFLDEAKATGKDVALVATWAQSLYELKTEIKKGVAMPLNVNNVDVTVCANTVFGITASVLSGLVSPTVLEDPLIAQIYHNSSSLIAHELATNLSSRPDLSLLYYPSHMEFNWFVSRTVAVMDKAKSKGPLPLAVMEEVYSILQAAVQQDMTKSVLSAAKQDENGDIFFDDFLGDGDVTKSHLPLERAEDRIFTTAMAVNALIYTWTDFNETEGRSRWKTNTPAQVKVVVAGCVSWLTKHTLDGNYDPWNAFFSGSGKGKTTGTNQYPANLLQSTNGTIWPWTHPYNYLEDTIAVKGYIEPEEYAKMLAKMKSPLVFQGYNASPGFFPFWSSEAYTYSVTMLALSRYSNTVG